MAGGKQMNTGVCQHGTPVLTIIQILINLIFRNMIQKLSIFLGNSMKKDTLHVKLPPVTLHNPRRFGVIKRRLHLHCGSLTVYEHTIKTNWEHFKIVYSQYN